MIRLPAILIVLMTCALVSRAQESDFHEFTDKKGQQILAMLLDVSPDNRLMKIRREDGQEFETEILVLSLDDQQYIKNWMKTRSVKTDYRLEIDITKKAGKTERHNRTSSSYTYEQRFSSFEITVRNLSRETVPDTTLEYILVWDDQILLYQIEGDWTYSNADEDDETTVKKSGSAPLAPIPFNREQIVSTEEIEVNRMVYGGDIYREDEQHGIMVRVLNENGDVLAEERSGTAALQGLRWELAMDLPEPRSRN